MTGPQNAQANNKLRACYIGEDLFLACIFILWTAHFNKDEDKKKKKIVMYLLNFWTYLSSFKKIAMKTKIHAVNVEAAKIDSF